MVLGIRCCGRFGASGLRQNGGIKYLSLHDCKFGEAEVNALCDALVVNTTVVKMRGLPEDAQSALRPYLEINETVRHFPAQFPPF